MLCVMLVPEASVDKYYSAPPRKNDVWSPRQVASVQPVPIARSMKHPADEHLGSRVARQPPRRGETPHEREMAVIHRAEPPTLGKFADTIDRKGEVGIGRDPGVIERFAAVRIDEGRHIDVS